VKGKFDNKEYKTITQFVADFRQMLENCYRFNGPDHFVSRRAQKLETMMEQKLNLLSRFIYFLFLLYKNLHISCHKIFCLLLF